MGYRFREAREKAGLSTYEVAKRIGVSQPAVNQWDNGNKLPSVEMLCKLADVSSTPGSTISTKDINGNSPLNRQWNMS